MSKDISEALRDLDAELTEWWKDIYKQCKSNKLFDEYEKNYKANEPYTMLAAKMGMFSGITAVQSKIKELREMNNHDTI